MIIRNLLKPDYRTLKYKLIRQRDRKLAQLKKRNFIMAVLTLLVLAVIVLWGTFSRYLPTPLVSPKGSGEVKVQEVQAIEIIPTPILARKYRYTQHLGKKYYAVILAGLQKRYINWQDAAELVSRECGFNPKAINPSSGACGLVQALPCSKMNCKLDDIDCQLDWQKDYIAGRYGTIAKALQFWNQNGWY